MIEETEAEILYSMLEYTAVLERPILEAWSVPANLVAVVLKALNPFGFQPDGVELKTRAEKLTENVILFRRNPPGVTFTVGVEKIFISAENLDWSDAERFIEAVRAGLDSVLKNGDSGIKQQHLVLGIHIQAKTKPRQEVTRHLLSEQALNLLDGELRMPGVILQREKASIIIDGSAAFANGLFVRINREHGAGTTLKEMAEMLRNDERQLFDVLGLEGEL